MTNRHRTFIRSLIVFTILTNLAGTGASAETLLVPAYFSSQTDWTAMTQAAQGGASITAILNPDSGPGTAQDPTLLSEVTAFELAGGTVVGYVPTSYAKRAASAVKTDIESYEKFYPIEGIFLDEMTDTAKSSYVTYYQGLYSFIKGQNASYDVIANPGSSVPSSYAQLADTLVTYESVGSTYPSNTAVTWSSGQPSSKFANIAYEVPDAATMFQDLAQAESQNVGYVYYTDDGADGNPYDSLPSYFSSEVGAAVPDPSAIAFGVAAVFVLRRRPRLIGSKIDLTSDR